MFSAFQENKFDTEYLARALKFDDLSKNYRVFAFPKSIHSRMEARRMANWLIEQLIRLPNGEMLPQNESQILGSSLEWDVYLFAEKCNEKCLFEAYRNVKPGVKPIDRQKKWRKEEFNYVEHFRSLEREIAAVFPVKMQTQK
jgi:hypothetical protein